MRSELSSGRVRDRATLAADLPAGGPMLELRRLTGARRAGGERGFRIGRSAERQGRGSRTVSMGPGQSGVASGSRVAWRPFVGRVKWLTSAVVWVSRAGIGNARFLLP